MNDELRDFLGHYDASDVTLDELLGSVQDEILRKLDAVTDLDAGLAEIIGDAASPDEVRSPSAVSAAGGLDEQSEVEQICAVITDLLRQLDLVARPDQPAPKGVGPSILYVRTIAGLLAELLVGLSQRRLSREDAAWTLHLVDHNLTEAKTLMAGEHSRAKRQARRTVAELIELMTGTAQQIQDLTPRIMRLFKDIGDTAPRERIPQ